MYAISIVPKISSLQKSPLQAVFRLLFILLIAPCILSGCHTTHLKAPALSEDLIRLSRLNKHPLSLTITGADQQTTLGRQFLFIAIPFGTVYSPSPRELIFSSLYTYLTTKGARITPGTSTLPALAIHVTDLTVHAYDLLLVRRLSADILLEATYTNELGTVTKMMLHGSASEFNARGFEPQLTKVLHRALEDAYVPLEVLLTLEH
jgi:hypothetical protein